MPRNTPRHKPALLFQSVLFDQQTMLDPLLSALLDLFWWPYDAWKHTTESSRVGISPDEKQTLRFWYAIGMTATIVIMVIVLACAIALHWLEG